jgi:hypothetical protein
MTTKQYLSQYRKYLSDIVFFKALKEDAIKNVASLKSPMFGDKISKSPENDPIGNLVFELEKDIAKYDMAILARKVKIMLIDKQLCEIRDINEDFYKLLSYKYKIGMDWQAIADKMYMGLSTVTHLHAPALHKFDELFGSEYRNA